MAYSHGEIKVASVVDTPVVYDVRLEDDVGDVIFGYLVPLTGPDQINYGTWDGYIISTEGQSTRSYDYVIECAMHLRQQGYEYLQLTVADIQSLANYFRNNNVNIVSITQTLPKKPTSTSPSATQIPIATTPTPSPTSQTIAEFPPAHKSSFSFGWSFPILNSIRTAVGAGSLSLATQIPPAQLPRRADAYYVDKKTGKVAVWLFKSGGGGFQNYNYEGAYIAKMMFQNADGAKQFLSKSIADLDEIPIVWDNETMSRIERIEERKHALNGRGLTGTEEFEYAQNMVRAMISDYDGPFRAYGGN